MLRRLLTFTILLFPLWTAVGQQWDDSQSSSVFNTAYDFFSSVENREEGSSGEQRIQEYIKDFAEERNLTVTSQSLDVAGARHSFSKNLIVRIPGNRNKELILIQEVNSGLFEYNDPENPALALTLMDQWSDTPPPQTLSFVFTSADAPQRGFLGSSSFIEHNRIPPGSVLLHLDLERSDEIPEIFGSTPSGTAPGWLMESLRSSFIHQRRIPAPDPRRRPSYQSCGIGGAGHCT